MILKFINDNNNYAVTWGPREVVESEILGTSGGRRI